MNRCRRSLAGRFLRHSKGAAAVEFALVVPLLLALIFSTIEAGWTMVQTIMLDRALDRTVRQLRIGSLPNPTQESVRIAVCDEALVLADCRANLALEFIPIINPTDYPSDQARCINRGGTLQPVLRFNPGARQQTVFVRACFVVEPLTPLLGLALALPKDESGAYRIVAKSAFANEPV
ncbi:MAG TPA: TadE/TadG family type IV pilus assembly protein [Devosia sp.]|jgi:Flp pilus assembly pilin Flp|nr:TadE/TadG family type IV pilus assembly protein [Devosia sp.]